MEEETDTASISGLLTVTQLLGGGTGNINQDSLTPGSMCLTSIFSGPPTGKNARTSSSKSGPPFSQWNLRSISVIYRVLKENAKTRFSTTIIYLAPRSVILNGVQRGSSSLIHQCQVKQQDPLPI